MKNYDCVGLCAWGKDRVYENYFLFNSATNLKLFKKQNSILGNVQVLRKFVKSDFKIISKM